VRGQEDLEKGSDLTVVSPVTFKHLGSWKSAFLTGAGFPLPFWGYIAH